jgi:hypothetical protein
MPITRTSAGALPGSGIRGLLTYGEHIVIIEMNRDGQFRRDEPDQFYSLFAVHRLSHPIRKVNSHHKRL